MPPVDGKNVQVTPEDFHTVATQIGHAVAQLGDAATRLHGATTAAAGLAGVDDGAKQFDTGYQQALNTLFAAFDRAGDVLTDVSLGIDLSGINHWNADAAAVPGGGPPPPWNLVSGLYLPQNLQATSLVGTPVIALPSPLDAKIPLGHQTLLHDLADRFTDAANSVDDVRTGLHNNLTELFANNSSADLDALNAFWTTLGGSGNTAILTAVSNGCQQLSQAVSGFADWIADTQNQILDQVITLTGQIAKQTALALIPSLIIDLFTDGLGGLPGLAKAFQDIGKFGELVAVVEAVDASAAARLAGGILAVAADANTAMSAAINTTPNPNLDPANPQTTPGAPNDTTEIQAAEQVGDRAAPARVFPPDEQVIADRLRAEGHSVEAIPTGTGRTADALVDDKPVEFKTMQNKPNSNMDSSTIRNILNDSKRNGGQARDILINAENVPLTAEEARRGIARFLGAHPGYYDSITIWLPDGTTVTWP